MAMEQTLQDKIERARELLRTVRHAALATVNEDGSPHNSPVFAGFGHGTILHWASSRDALHSRNIERSGQAFVVLFDSMDRGGGSYMQCTAGVLEGRELGDGLAAFNTSLTRLGRSPVSRELFIDNVPQRLYYAQPQKLWVNMSQKDAAGRVLSDARYEISAQDLE
jgi:hypothetical protein